jgi:hypothetical protein
LPGFSTIPLNINLALVNHKSCHKSYRQPLNLWFYSPVFSKLVSFKTSRTLHSFGACSRSSIQPSDLTSEIVFDYQEANHAVLQRHVFLSCSYQETLGALL